MSERAAYSRVYWSIVDDEKFVTIYDNDSHLAAWMRLLLIADQAHPASAHLPSNVRRGSVKALSDANLIDLLPGSRYRIRGLDAERERRRLAATSRGDRPPTEPRPSGPRPVTERSPAGIQTPVLRRDEPRVDEPSQDDAHAEGDVQNDPWAADETEAVSWLAKHGCYVAPGNGFRNHVVTMVQSHGINAVIGMLDRLAAEGMKSGDTRGYVFGAKDALNARHRPNLAELEKAEATEERADVRSKRIQRQMWERRHEAYRNTGHWEPEWGDPPSVEGKGAA